MSNIAVDRVMYPFESKYIQLDSGKLHYLDEGTGDPVVMVHGNPAWSFSFRHLVKALSNHCRCIAPDHIGFGLSDKPTNWDYLPQSHASNLEQFLNHLNLQNITLVFNDWGGPIALHYATKYPDKIKALVIMNSWCWSVRGDKHFERFSKFMGGAIGRFLIKRFNFFVKVFMKKIVYNSSVLTPEIMRNYLTVTQDPDRRKGMYILPKAIISESEWLSTLENSIKEKLSHIPSLILWGEHDVAFREKELKHWESLFPERRLKTLKYAGHFPEEETPKEVIDEIKQFLSEITPK